MNLSSQYDAAYARYLSTQRGDSWREQVLRETKGLMQLVRECQEKFLQDRLWETMQVVELGSGMAGLGIQLAQMGAKVTVVDFSATALDLASELARSMGVEIETLCLDVSQPDSRLGRKFDVMVDSHLLHCLPLGPARISYFQLIKDHLAPSGIFLGETMVHRKKIFIPDGYRLDDDNVLWQNLGEWTPVRKIADSLELEAEFKNAGLNICYFYYYANYAMAPSPDFWDIPADILPASVRYCLRG